MKKFAIYYSFDIKSPEKDLVVESGHGTFELEASSMKALNTKFIKGKIAKIAQDSRTDESYYVGYSNYYKIVEVIDNEV